MPLLSFNLEQLFNLLLLNTFLFIIALTFLKTSS